MTDSSETITDTYQYDAFGVLLDKTGTTINPFQFGGSWGYCTDPDTGHLYIRARIYIPWQGRWTSVDILLFVNGPNVYVAYFVPNGVDPSGTLGVVIGICVVGAFALLSGCGRRRSVSTPRGLDSVRCGCVDLRNSRRRSHGAVIALETIIKRGTFINDEELNAQLTAMNIHQVGELGIGMIGQGNGLPEGEQAIERWVEDPRGFSANPQTTTHPGGRGGNAKLHADANAAAELLRMQILVKELDAELSRRGCP